MKHKILILFLLLLAVPALAFWPFDDTKIIINDRRITNQTTTSGGIGFASTAFTDGNLVSSVLTFDHNLNVFYPAVVVFDESDEIILPDVITSVDVNSVTIDLTSFAPLSGVWHVSAVGGAFDANILADQFVTVATFNNAFPVSFDGNVVFDSNAVLDGRYVRLDDLNNQTVSQIIAGDNISISPTNGIGAVTVNTFGLVSSSVFNTAFDADFNANNVIRLLQDSNCDENINCVITGDITGAIGFQADTNAFTGCSVTQVLVGATGCTNTPVLTGTNFTGVPAASILAGTFGTGSYIMDTDLTLSGSNAQFNLSQNGDGNVSVFNAQSLNVRSISTSNDIFAVISSLGNTMIKFRETGSSQGIWEMRNAANTVVLNFDTGGGVENFIAGMGNLRVGTRSLFVDVARSSICVNCTSASSTQKVRADQSSSYTLAGRALSYYAAGTGTGNGTFGGAIGFASDFGGFPQAVIASKQLGGDSDIVGLAFFVHPSATGSAESIEAASLSQNGDWNALGIEDSLSFPVQSTKISHFTSPAKIDGSQDGFALAFDDTADEYSSWCFTMPDTYTTTQTLYFDGVFSMREATTGDVILNVRVAAISTGDSQDWNAMTYDSNNALTIAVPSTQGRTRDFSIPLSNNDSVAPNDYLCVDFIRDADDASDDAIGDLQLIGSVRPRWAT